MRAAPPVTSFRIYPWGDGNGLYARVCVFATKADMYSHRPLERTHAACFQALQVRRAPSFRLRPLFGEVNFHLAKMGIAIVTHEFLHATFEWSRRKRIDLDCVASDDARRYSQSQNPEEQICWAHGEMVRQFYVRAYKLGLIERTPCTPAR